MTPYTFNASTNMSRDIMQAAGEMEVPPEVVIESCVRVALPRLRAIYATHYPTAEQVAVRMAAQDANRRRMEDIP